MLISKKETCCFAAFTMAEILLSLTIIGVVAAITLPSLTGNINERTWNTQRKALYARMSQAISLMPALNGYGTYTYTSDENGTTSPNEDTAAETFVTDGLSKVLKINNICDNNNLADCGLPSSITTLNASIINLPTKLSELNPNFTDSFDDGEYGIYQNPQSDINTKAAAFETQNGESILVFYNPYCKNVLKEWRNYVYPRMCANFIYDLNGNKGPNTIGKDIGFITVFDPTDSNVVAPQPLVQKTSNYITYQVALGLCNSNDREARLPNRDELSALLINKRFLDRRGIYWSSTSISAQRVWNVHFDYGLCESYSRYTDTAQVQCIKR